MTDLASDSSDRVSEVSEHARAAGSETVATAGQNVAKVKDETVSQAKDLVGQTRDQLTAQANNQLGQLGSTIRRLATELEEMGQRSEHDGMARSVVKDAAQRSHRLADKVEGREIADVLADVRHFARQRPGLFLLGAAGLGVLVGRMGRGIRDAGESESSQSEPSVSASAIPPSYPEPTYAEQTYSDPTYSDPNYPGAEVPAAERGAQL